MSDLRELYQELILDHSQRPRNFRSLPCASHHAEGHNPLCGDRVAVYLAVEGDTVSDIAFEGTGCAISKASASLMTASLKGKTTGEARALFERFHRVVTGRSSSEEDLAALGKLAVFAGVQGFPARVKCASLAWHTLRAALEGASHPITTE